MPTHQMSLDLIHHQADGTVIDQRTGDGYINATALCKATNKEWHEYRRNSNTIAFLAELESDLEVPISDLVHSIKGGVSSMQGTWVHPQVAVNLAAWLSPKFAVKVSKWVADWMSGKGPAQPSILPVHIRRYMANDPKVPPGHFSVLQETGVGLFGPLHLVGFDIPEGWVPDISVGKLFCTHLRTLGIDTEALPTYPHDYLDGRSLCYPKAYPDEHLATYRTWFRSVWLPENGRKYFKSKDPKSLAFLNKIPALAMSVKNQALPK